MAIYILGITFWLNDIFSHRHAEFWLARGVPFNVNSCLKVTAVTTTKGSVMSWKCWFKGRYIAFTLQNVRIITVNQRSHLRLARLECNFRVELTDTFITEVTRMSCLADVGFVSIHSASHLLVDTNWIALLIAQDRSPKGSDKTTIEQRNNTNNGSIN